MHHTIRTALAFSVAAGVSGAGCHATTASMAPTGEPLRVDVKTNEEKFVKYDRVIQPGEYAWLDGLYQGNTRIEDELDFYHVAGDKEKEESIIAWRKQSNFASLVAWGAFGGSVVVLGGGVGLMAAQGGFQDENYLASENGQIALGLMTVGGILLGAAPLSSMLVGPEQTITIESPPESAWTYELLYSKEAANITAMKYNESLNTPAAPAEAAPAE